MISHMAGFWARLFGRNNDPRSTANAATPDSPPPRRTAQNPNDNLVEVRRGERWEEVVEVSGEAQFRRSFQKIFMTLGRPEGGVTFQDARLIPTRKGIIGVQIMGETVGYLDDDEDFYVATVKRSLARLGKDEVAVIHARIWAIVDQAGLWRARVSLAHNIGAGSREEDYREKRLTSERWEAERAAKVAEQEAARAERASARAAKQKLEADAIAAGSFNGAHWSEQQPTAIMLKAEARTDELAALLEQCVDAAEAEAKVRNLVPAQWPTVQLGMIYRERGDFAAEVALLERFVDACGDEPTPKRIAGNLAKAHVAASQ